MPTDQGYLGYKVLIVGCDIVDSHHYFRTIFKHNLVQ